MTGFFTSSPIQTAPKPARSRLTRREIMKRLQAGEPLSLMSDTPKASASFPDGLIVPSRSLMVLLAEGKIEAAPYPAPFILKDASPPPIQKAGYRIQVRLFEGFRKRGWGYGQTASYSPWRTRTIRPTLEAAEKEGAKIKAAGGLLQVRIVYGTKTLSTL